MTDKTKFHANQLHAILDGETRSRPNPDTPEARELARYEKAVGMLESCEERAPEDLCRSVMSALPDKPGAGLKDRFLNKWPKRGRWSLPLLTGALSVMILLSGVLFLKQVVRGDRLQICFLIHAPWAKEVEVVGTFSCWMPSGVQLEGPDAAGNWNTKALLPPGRHEYLFLVDDRYLLPDPSAAMSRPDGFGGVNSVVDLFEETYPAHNPANPAATPEQWQQLKLTAEVPRAWQDLADKGARAGVERGLLERALARLAMARRNLSDNLHLAVSHIFHAEKEGLPSEYLIAYLNEGTLKQVSDEAIAAALKNSLTHVKLARKMVHAPGETDESADANSPLSIAVAEALQSGVPEKSLERMLADMRDRPLERRMVLTECGETLYSAGLDASSLDRFFQSCIRRDLDWQDIRHLTAQLKGELLRGNSVEGVLNHFLAHQKGDRNKQTLSPDSPRRVLTGAAHS